MPQNTEQKKHEKTKHGTTKALPEE